MSKSSVVPVPVRPPRPPRPSVDVYASPPPYNDPPPVYRDTHTYTPGQQIEAQEAQNAARSKRKSEELASLRMALEDTQRLRASENERALASLKAQNDLIERHARSEIAALKAQNDLALARIHAEMTAMRAQKKEFADFKAQAVAQSPTDHKGIIFAPTITITTSATNTNSNNNPAVVATPNAHIWQSQSVAPLRPPPVEIPVSSPPNSNNGWGPNCNEWGEPLGTNGWSPN